VTFYPLSDEELKGYISTGEPLDKAGAYGIQGPGSILVERVEGCYFTVMGLPNPMLYQALRQVGVSPHWMCG
jgi:septum formation protein